MCTYDAVRLLVSSFGVPIYRKEKPVTRRRLWRAEAMLEQPWKNISPDLETAKGYLPYILLVYQVNTGSHMYR